MFLNCKGSNEQVILLNIGRNWSETCWCYLLPIGKPRPRYLQQEITILLSNIGLEDIYVHVHIKLQFDKPQTIYFLQNTWRPDRFLKSKVFRRVDLPAPLAPIIARNSPGLTIPLAEMHIFYMCCNNEIFVQTIVQNSFWCFRSSLWSKESTKPSTKLAWYTSIITSKLFSTFYWSLEQWQSG